ncbi:ImmA/IrrE family metallo-endopeptidase [Magnetovirga frankeli]|uniref:ImmA/IrrE family metallo-endopeptidase n=1 Tax=Magnetovirga frankeli TaxID=947516 RepID=UPI001293B21D|nr:ImmA/IrrE family metallo-endopeptidase [gamma proteobacterium SS-5]
MQLRVIKSENDYQAGMAALAELMELDPAPGSPEADQLELLGLLLEQYEDQHFPMDAPDPVDAILFRMDQQGLINNDLVPLIGSKSKVSEVLNRKRPLSLSMIRKLHAELGIPAEVLLQEPGQALPLESEEDYSKYPIKPMQANGYFTANNLAPAELKDYAEELVTGFFRRVDEPALVARFRHSNNQPEAHKRSKRDLDPYALKAWCGRVAERAKQQSVGAYRQGAINDQSQFMARLAELSSFDNGPLLAQEHLARYGIHLIIEPHLPKTYLDGAALLLGNGQPVIGMTLRHDRIDNFWFVLLHELAHVALHLHDSKDLFVDDLDSESDDTQEREADQLALNALLPDALLEASPAWQRLDPKAVLKLARSRNIHSAIIVGRIQHKKHNYRLFSRSLGRGQGEVRRLFGLT